MPQSILVYRTGQLGDTLVSLPALWAIRKEHPQARLTLLTDDQPGAGLVSSREILEPTGIFAEILSYHPHPSPWTAGLQWHRIASQLRRLQLDRLYYLSPIPRTRRQVWRDRLFFQGLCGIQDTRGLHSTDDVFGRRDSCGNPLPLLSETLRLLRIVSPSEEDIRFDVPIGDVERAAVDRIWGTSGLSMGERPIAVGPGSKVPAKRWPRENYAALAQRLLSRFPEKRLLIIGGSEDRDNAQWLCQQTGPRALNWAGRLTVLESAEALRRCSLFVGNDSGPMHLAAAVGTRCVAIFSATNHPGLWEPYGTGHVILRKQVSCAGCALSVCKERALVCLTSITVEEVLQGCLSTIEVASTCG